MTEDNSKIIKLRDGRILGYIEYGSPKGKPLFYFHGWPGSRFSGAETDEAAKKLSIRVISTDRPGIGLSSYKENRTLLDWPDDVLELADQLKIAKFALMGCSGGGPYVAACTYTFPDRITKAGIVVGLAPVTVEGNLTKMAIQGKLGWANYHRFPLLRTIATLGAAIEFSYFPRLGSLIAFPTKTDRQIFKTLLTVKGSGHKEAFRQGLKGPRHELKIYTDDYGFSLNKIQAKIFLWYGAQDKSVPLAMGKYYHSQIPNSELLIDPEGGHLSRYHFEERILHTLTA